MGKKKWTGPNERKRQHMHHGKGGRGGRGRGGGRGGGRRDGDGEGGRSRGELNPMHVRSRSNNERPPPENTGPRVGLTEKDVGITEYVGNTPGFTGVIKARFSDFQVNEIDSAGNVVRLTDKSIPVPPKIDEEQVDENEKAVIELITVENWQRIIDVAASDPKNRAFVEIDVDHLTKEQRSLIHNTVKEIFGKDLIGSTLDKANKKHIKLARFVKGERDNRSKWVWPHEYTYFVVHKENCDTMKAAADLASYMNTHVSSLAYAGTKDKRGKTSQLFCIRKREPEKIVRAAERLTHLHVGNFTFHADTLKLGSLRGNQFRIALRQIDAEPETIDASLASLKEAGFINYYGMQRFGNCVAIPTHRVGLALLQGKFEEAVELVLKPREGDPSFMRAVREHWWKHRDAEAALKLLFKTNTGVEAKLLAGLYKNGPNDYVNALENIPRNMRLMYIHAYQSLVWNEIASRRVQLGHEPLVGDLVYVDEAAAEAVNQELADDEVIVAEEDPDKAPEEEEEAAKVAEEVTEEEEVSRFRKMVRPLTAVDIASGKYNLSDVVLTLPGHDITYPTNECGEWYRERLARDGLSSEKLKQKQKAYSLTGAYRKLIVRPEHLTWQLIRHATDTDNLIRSDLEEMKGEPAVESVEDGALQSLLVQFQLPSSTYATMVLREILKEDTSPANQSKLAQEAAAAAADAKVVDGAEEEDDDDDEDEDAAEATGAEKRKLDNDDDDDDKEDEVKSKKSKTKSNE